MPGMRLNQAAVTQHFGIKPPHLAAESSHYHIITEFRDEAVTLQLPSRQWVILCGFILDAVSNTA
jgi:hypothetical protein